MHYTRLGKSDLEVSKICLGTMTFGEQNTEAEAHAQFDYAIEQGINFIDTAELYAVPSTKENNGLTEQYIGTWLKHRPDRDRLIVATKVVGPGSNLSYIRNPIQFTPEQIKEAIDGSLRRLQTEYVDLYQLHWPERHVNNFGVLNYPYDANEQWEDNFLHILETMSALVKAGKIRYFGISNETPWGLMRFLQLAEQHGLPRCISIQNPYSLVNRTFEIGLSEITLRENVGLMAYSPMAFGLLSGKFHSGKDTPRDRINKYSNRLTRYNGDLTRKAAGEYANLAIEHGLSPAQMALAFVNSRPFVTSTIIGATTMEQLKENINSIYVSLNEDVLKKIEKIHQQIPNPAP